jgi:uncharacterized membrane protein YhiD involved in acid resistance
VPDFLTAPFRAEVAIAPLEVATRLVLALVLGAVVAWIYRATRADADYLPSFPPTLVLLSVLIAMVLQVIGESIARAFSLVGALSVVRFRTVVRDTQDTAFVIFAVVVGMASGAGDPRVALIGIVVVGAAAFVMKRRAGQSAEQESFMMTVRLAAGTEIEKTVGTTLDAHLLRRRLRGASTAKQGSALDAEFIITFRVGKTPDQLISALNQIDTVHGVEITRRRSNDDDDDD